MKQSLLFVLFFVTLQTLFAQCPPPVCPDYWGIKGNIGTNPALNNFVGTIDNMGLSFRTNNAERAKISASGLYFINRIATATNPSPGPILSADAGVNLFLSSWTGGTLNLSAYKEKGRLFHIVNYSGAGISVSDTIRIGQLTSTTVIPNNGRYYIQWTGTEFVLLSAN